MEKKLQLRSASCCLSLLLRASPGASGSPVHRSFPTQEGKRCVLCMFCLNIPFATCMCVMQEWAAASFDALGAVPDAKSDHIHLPGREPIKRQNSRVFSAMQSARRRTIDLSRRLMRSGPSATANVNSSTSTAAANVYGASVSTAGRDFRWKMTGQAGSLTCMAPEVRKCMHV